MTCTDKVNRGTLTTKHMNENFPIKHVSSATEVHNSTSFLTEILNDINYSKTTMKTQDLAINSCCTSISSDDPESNSPRNLYEMKSLLGGEKSPIKINFKLHNKSRVTDKKNDNKHCRFSDQISENLTDNKLSENQIENNNNNNVNGNKNSKDINKFEEFHHIPTSSQSIPANPILITQQTRKQHSLMERLKRSFNKINNQNKLRHDYKTKYHYMQPQNESPKSAASSSSQIEERMEIYYFDHGSAEYFRTTDCPPNIMSEVLAQQTTYYATRFWGEIFGSLHIGVTFFVTFFLQTYRFLLYSIVRSALIGFLQITSDYFIKPLITVLFNGYLQPPLILIYNILSSIKDMLEPIADIFEMFLRPIEGLCKSFRLVNVRIVRDLRRNDDQAKAFVKEV